MLRWVLYYAVILLGTAAAALAFPDAVSISVFSVIPAVCMVVLVFCGWFFQSKYQYRVWLSKTREYRVKYDRDLEFIEEPSRHTDTSPTEADRFHSKMCLLFVPFLVIFILFFGKVLKSCSILLLVPPHLIALAYCFKISNRSYDEERAKREKERKEQEAKEALGKWK